MIKRKAVWLSVFVRSRSLQTVVGFLAAAVLLQGVDKYR